MNSMFDLCVEETDKKKVITSSSTFSTSAPHQLYCIENYLKSGSEICGSLNSNSLNISDRKNYSMQHSEGEIGEIGKEMTEYMIGYSNNITNNTPELFMTSYNDRNSSHLQYLSKPAIKLLSNISNKDCMQNNENLSTSSFNCSENFGDYCPIKCQEQNRGFVNIYNSYSKVSSLNTFLHSTNVKSDYCERNATNNSSPSSVKYDNNHKKIERPITINIVRRNWNMNDNKITPQESVLDHVHSSLLNISSNLSEKNIRSDLQLHLGQMNTNKNCHGNVPIVSLQREQQNVPCPEKYIGDNSESGNIIRVHSFQIGSGSSKDASLPCGMKRNSCTSKEDLIFTNYNSVKDCSENVEEQSKVNEMIQTCKINPVHLNQDILKTLKDLSVVHKKLKWSCSFCGESQATRLSLTTHIKSHLLPWCKTCLKVVHSNEQLLSHMEKKHLTLEMHVDQPQTQLVTSKYGRKRLVYSPATLLPKRRLDLKK